MVKLGLHKAFRVGHDENDNVEVPAITRIARCEIGGTWSDMKSKQETDRGGQEAFMCKRQKGEATVCFLLMQVR